MTVSSALNRKTYAGDAVTTSFATSPMTFFDSADLIVRVVDDDDGTETLLTENTQYTVTGGSGSTGTVNLAGGSSPYGAPAVGTTLVIVRELDIVQEFDPENNDASDADALEQSLDKITMMLQHFDDHAARSVRLSDGDVSGLDTTLPTPEASKLIGIGSDGVSLALYATSVITTGTTLSALGEDIAGATDGDEVFQLIIDGATAESTPATGDYVMISDVSLTPDDGRKVTLGNIFTTLGNGQYQDIQIFSTPGTVSYTKPANLKRIEVIVVGGGGGGGGADSSGGGHSVGGGGGGGGAAIEVIEAASVGATESVIVGAGGTAGDTTGSTGGTGGTTSFGSHCSASGGGGGTGQTGASAVKRSPRPGLGGVGSGGDVNFRGGCGQFGVATTSTEGFGGNGGDSFMGGGGVSVIDGAAVDASAAGQNYGGGGAGATSVNGTDRAGAAGAGGIVIVREYF